MRLLACRVSLPCPPLAAKAGHPLRGVPPSPPAARSRCRRLPERRALPPLRRQRRRAREHARVDPQPHARRLVQQLFRSQGLRRQALPQPQAAEHGRVAAGCAATAPLDAVGKGAQEQPPWTLQLADTAPTNTFDAENATETHQPAPPAVLFVPQHKSTRRPLRCAPAAQQGLMRRCGVALPGIWNCERTCPSWQDGGRGRGHPARDTGRTHSAPPYAISFI